VNALVARIAAGVTLLAGAGVLFGPQPVAIAGGILLGFVLPGLALTESLFRHRSLTAVERTMLAPALSLAVLVSAGLVIYAAGYALDRVAWTSATVLVALGGLVVPGVPIRTRAERMALAAAASNDKTEMIPIIRDGDPDPRTGTPALPPPLVRPVPPKERPPLKRIARQLIPMVLVLAILGFGGWYSFDSSRRGYDVTVTALSAVPSGTPDAAGQRTLEVAATGLVAADGPYSVVVTGETGTPLIRRSVPVPGDGEWSELLTVGPDRTTISLYRAGDTTTPYRTLFIAAEEQQ
jgi:hypothetical protein